MGTPERDGIQETIMADPSRYRERIFYKTTRSTDGRDVLRDSGWEVVNYGKGDCLEPQDYTADQGTYSTDREITGIRLVDEKSELTPISGNGGNVGLAVA